MPILQPHRGEMDALLNLPPATRRQITPLIEIATMKGVAEISPQSPLSRIGETLQHAIGEDEVFFIDFHSHVSRSVVLRVVQDCLLHGLSFIPVIRPERIAQGRAILDAVGRERGVALRVAISPFTPTGMGLDDLIQEMLEETELSSASADLFLDLGRLHGVLTAEDVVAVLSEINDIHSWRKLVMCRTTMPPGFGQDQFALNGDTALPRREWDLHLEVRRLTVERVPVYSDYGIQGTGRPDKGFRPIPNLRYTADTHTVVLRGNRQDPNGEQHATLCARLLKRREFQGPGFSRGDRLIADCARRQVLVKDQEVMRSIGTSHHLELVTTALSSLSDTPA